MSNDTTTLLEVNIIPKFLDSALTPVAKETGERLADIVNLVFTPVIKAKAKRDKNIELFLKELDAKVSSIPEEKLQEPPLHIVGPILDDVFKFYHDKNYLREMFANLIASSMNSEREAHPAYREIIRQLSQLDALVFQEHINFTLGHSTETRFNFYTISHKTSFSFDFIEDITPLKDRIYFCAEENSLYHVNDSILSSLSSLMRLGLISGGYKKMPISIFEKYNVIPETSGNCLIKIYRFVTAPTTLGIEFAKTCCNYNSNQSRASLKVKAGRKIDHIHCSEHFISYNKEATKFQLSKIFDECKPCQE